MIEGGQATIRSERHPKSVTAIFPAPAYVLARGAWVLWHTDGRLARLEDAPCVDYAAALAASWRPRPGQSEGEAAT
jgi:hypothetical protein